MQASEYKPNIYIKSPQHRLDHYNLKPAEQEHTYFGASLYVHIHLHLMDLLSSFTLILCHGRYIAVAIHPPRNYIQSHLPAYSFHSLEIATADAFAAEY